ncbi:hypothetical protein BGX38DRAFT_1280773 [Terfezia claveryi]|nr:hypothetical protein BGX38DRAFT_1280773 [Terfezia claveryi]
MYMAAAATSPQPAVDPNSSSAGATFPPVRPPAPPPMHPPLQALAPLQPQRMPAVHKPKYKAVPFTGRDHLGPDARHAQRHTQLAPLPFYPRLGHIERASHNANNLQQRGMPQHPGRRMLATEANSIQHFSRQTRRSAFFQRQVQRRAEIERLAAERLQRDMQDGASDEERYWKGGVQNLARKQVIPNMQELEQLSSHLRLSCEKVWKWLESVKDE